MPTLESEIQLIESISQSQVLAITVSHENMSTTETQRVIAEYEDYFQVPTTDVLSDGCQKLIQALGQYFPQLNQKIKQEGLEKVLQLAMG